MDNIKVLLVDDHQMVIEGLKIIVGQIDGIRIVGTAKNAFEALQLIWDISVDVAIFDIGLPGVDRIELCKRIKKECPAYRCWQ